LVVPSPLEILQKFTTARIGLGRAGTSLPTQPHLAFQLAHARARDAVHHALDVKALMAALGQRGHDNMALHSGAADRHIYLQRPDQGRRLDDDSCTTLQKSATFGAAPDVVIIIADGLSAVAIEANAIPFLDLLLPKLACNGWSVAPIIIVEQGRVAVGDEVGELLRAHMVVVLIGERPGLSAADSMGIYLTYQPIIGTTDARRNCISNVRHGGMRHEDAADKLFYLIGEARSRKLSGVLLKDLAALPSQHIGEPHRNFLVGGG
jgi:ethanolamine ammonia-lyase small subunit